MEIDEQEEKLYRELELKYDKLYQEVYEQRKQLLQGATQPSEELLKQYEDRAKELDDDDFKQVEADAIDVKDIQNTPLGVYGFWFRVMLNDGIVGRLIQEKDRPILMHLTDVQCILHEKGFGYDLIFAFEKNDYFTNETLKKSFVMSKQNIIDKCEGTTINWKDGKNVTEKKVKKKSKKKGAKAVTKTVEQESFFNFFKTIEMPDEKDLANPDHEKEDEEEKDVGELMDADFDVGNEFKDQLIPLALEYYMEVIEEEEDGECCSDDECDEGHGGHHHGKGGDSDEDEKPKKKKGGDKKGGAAGGAGQQQECKQQ
jgi:nucleosome assembly protein 1-like 1